MTVTKQFLKAEIDKVNDRHLEEIYRLVREFARSQPSNEPDESWQDFIDVTFGCMADAPIERAEQGTVEVRELFQ